MRVALAALIAAGALAPVGGLEAQTARLESDSCSHASDARSVDRWQRVPGPPGELASMGQFDHDACQLFATTSDGRGWRSRDAGLTWVSAPGATRVLTAGLGTASASAPTAPGLVVANIPVNGVSFVEVSRDGGAHFTRALLRSDGETTPVPLVGRIEDAASAGLANGNRTLYLTIAPPVTSGTSELVPSPVSTEVTPSSSRLLVSTDDGASFAAVVGAARISPTIVTVNPASPKQIWVNNWLPNGGAYVSDDGGLNFRGVTATLASTENLPGVEVGVTGIAVAATSGGNAEVLLATPRGLWRSVNQGLNWLHVPTPTTALTGVRTPPDGPNSLLIQTPAGVLFRDPGANAPSFVPLLGLPRDCGPTGLRRDSLIPPTFLVDCPSLHATYRLYLSLYGWPGARTNPPVIAPAAPPPYGLPGSGLGYPVLGEVATWSLPESFADSGAIAFDGTTLFYDRGPFVACRSWTGNCGTTIGMIRASDGGYVGSFKPGSAIFSLSYDTRRHRLLITDGESLQLSEYDVTTRHLRRLRRAPDKTASYDASIRGMSWIPEYGSVLQHGAQATETQYGGCTLKNYPPPGGGLVSTFVAAGDGGGYIADENDRYVYRINANCELIGAFAHRNFSESPNENDTLACDAQTFYPQAVLWIRDSTPGTVTAYGLTDGYCPMPSGLVLSAPDLVQQGTVASICARLTNETTGLPMAERPVTFSASGAPVGRTKTDAAGDACVLYLAPLLSGRLFVPLSAAFAGDGGLYPSIATGGLTVVGSTPPPPVPPAVAVVPPILPPPLGPPLNPLINPAPGPVTGNISAPNPVQAAQGQAQAQTQSVVQGVVVPQKQEQPQLVFARAANTVQNEAGSTGYSMSALPPSKPDSSPRAPALAAGAAFVLASCLGAAMMLGRRRGPAQATSGSAEPTRRIATRESRRQSGRRLTRPRRMRRGRLA